MREWGAAISGLMLLLMILSRRDRRSEYRLTASLLTLSSISGRSGPSIVGPGPGEEQRDWLDEGVEEEAGEGWGVFGRWRIFFKVSISTPSRSATLVKAMESQWVPRFSSS